MVRQWPVKRLYGGRQRIDRYKALIFNGCYLNAFARSGIEQLSLGDDYCQLSETSTGL